MWQSILSMPRGSKELAEGDEPFAEAEVVLAGFLRIVTNAKNLRSADSNENRDRLVPATRRVSTGRPGCAQPAALGSLCWTLHRYPGPLVTDAYLAALVIEHGCELITTDGDFARFKGLRWRHPLSA
jgi:predicted nucleic acid-binding protein